MRTLERLWLDLRYALRSLRRTPTVTAAAIVTLALGIGAVTTVFSMFQAVLLRKLAVRAPEQLYFVAHRAGDNSSTSSNYPWYERVAQHTDVFAGVTAYNVRDLKVSSAQGVETVPGQYASGNYHSVIGAPFALGRGFTSENDRTFTPIAVISYDYWTRRFGRDPNVLGTTVTVGGHQVTIVGVTARGFNGMQPGGSLDITLPLSIRVQDDPEFVSRTDTWTSMPLIVRLRDGVELARAQSAIASTYRSHMSLPANVNFSQTRGQLREGVLQPAARGADRLRRAYETPLQVLLGMVGVVLLIACVNFANLLLTRAPARAREVAVRMSIGASRRRVAAELLTESTLLAVGGGALGILLAAWGTELVSKLFRTGLRPIVID